MKIKSIIAGLAVLAVLLSVSSPLSARCCGRPCWNFGVNVAPVAPPCPPPPCYGYGYNYGYGYAPGPYYGAPVPVVAVPVAPPGYYYYPAPAPVPRPYGPSFGFSVGRY
jgi:hypothetical protein